MLSKFRAGGSSRILVWQAIVKLSNIGVADNTKSFKYWSGWQAIVNLSNIGVAADTPATLVVYIF